MKNSANAQNNICGFDEYSNNLISLNPSLKEEMERKNTALYEYLSSNTSNQRTFNSGNIIVPVVVHVIHDPVDSYGVGTNITDEQINNQIEALNYNFRNEFGSGSYAVDTKIQFCLASKKPDGTVFNGINRMASPLTDSESLNSLLNLINYDGNKYVNIYVVKSFLKDGVVTQTVGKATPPWSDGNKGIAVIFWAFGDHNTYSSPTSPLSSNTEGKTLVHEMGHYLGLAHTFEGEENGGCKGMLNEAWYNNDNCSVSGDFVCDTPPVLTQTLGCPVPRNTCNENYFPDPENDHMDMIENFMDYADDPCKNTFTAGQSERMNATFVIYRELESLISFDNIYRTGCLSEGLYANIYSSNFTTQFCTGESINLEAIPTPLNLAVLYEWTFSGGTPSDYIGPNPPSVFYNSNGVFNATLKVTNNIGEVKENSIPLYVNNCTPIISSKSRWYFGHFAGLDFSTGTAKPNTEAYYSTPQTINTEFISITQSDENGNLLFYSDGINLWDKQHQLINNNLHLQMPDLQSILSLKDPENSNKYFLITVPSYNESYTVDNFGSYRKIDVSSGVAVIDGPSQNPIPLPSGCMGLFENVTAIPKCNGLDFWVIFGTSKDDPVYPNSFLVYELTKDGFSYKSSFNINSTFERGRLKFSPNGKFLAITLDKIYEYNKTYIFEFDKRNGVTNLIKEIPLGGVNLSFSSNSNILYFSNEDLDYSGIADLFQLDLTNIDSPNSLRKFTIREYVSDMQLGPDNRIYLSIFEENRLSVINFPDNLMPYDDSNIIGLNLNGLALFNSLTENIRVTFGIVNLADASDYTPLEFTSVSNSNVSCALGFDGIATVNVANGTTPYHFSWNSVPEQFTSTATSLYSGSYTVTVYDANNCTVTGSTALTEPTPLVITLSEIPTHCNGGNDGELYATVTGGASPYSFNWSNGAIVSNSIGLSAGTYTVTITDNNGCTISASSTISEPLAFSVTLTGTNLSCYGIRDGSLNTTVDGVTAPYSFAWSNGKNTSSLSLLNEGIYTVTVTDINGCTNTGSATLSMPSVLEVSVTGTNITCKSGYDGTATVIVNGGTVPYTFTWSNGASDENPTGLTAGNYTVTVTDYNGCTSSATVRLNEPSAITVLTQSNYVSCNNGFDGSIEVVLSGGSTPYSLVWSNGSTDNINNELTAGIYTVTVSDANNCTVTSSTLIKAPSQVTISHIITELFCDTDNATINISVDGGISPFSYSWSNTETTEDLENLTADTYTVTVTDANFCTATKSITIDKFFDIQNGGTVDNVTISDTWNSNMKINGIVEVPNGVTLTINTATIEFAEFSGILALPGSNIVLKDATLTNLTICSNLWNGVDLRGRPNENGAFISFIMTNSTIENAITGVFDNSAYKTHGGEQFPNEIIINNCYFINNQTSFKTRGGGFQSNNPIRYISNSYFYLTPAMNGSLTLPVTFVDIYHSDPIYLSTNQFINTANITDESLLPVAINSFQSEALYIIKNNVFDNLSLSLSSFEDDLILMDGNEIKNSTMGVYKRGIGYTNTIMDTITSNLFTNVKRGINMLATLDDRITGNIFTDIPQANATTGDTYGMYLINSEDCLVEDNQLSGTGATGGTQNPVPNSAPASYGIVAAWTNQNLSTIYDNTFNDLTFQLQTQDDNSELNVRCNYFYDPGTMGWVTFDELRQQGKDCKSTTNPQTQEITNTHQAGNEWTYCDNSIGNNKDIYVDRNSAPDGFLYFAHLRDENLDEYITNPRFCTNLKNNIDLEDMVVVTTELNVCNKATEGNQKTAQSCSTATDGRMIAPPDHPKPDWDCLTYMSKVQQKINDYVREINGAKAQIKRYDGGIKEELIRKIHQQPPLANKPLKDLLTRSFPLSDEVMSELMKRKQPFAPDMLSDILVANSPLGNMLMDKLRRKEPPIPPTALKRIEQAQLNQPTFLKIKDLQGLIKYYEGEIQLLTNYIGEASKTCESKEQWLYRLKNSPILGSKKRLIEHYYREKKYPEAKEQLNEITQMTDTLWWKESADKERFRKENVNYCKLMNCLIDAESNGKVLIKEDEHGNRTSDLSTNELNIIREVANEKIGISVRAEILLTEITGEKFEHPFKKISPSLQARKAQENKIEDIKNFIENRELNIYPNPGSNLININVSGLEEGQSAIFKVYDLLGSPIYSYYFNEKKNNIVWNTEKLSNSIYFYTYSKTGEVKEKGKIIIVK